MRFAQLLEIVGERPLFEPSLLLAGDVDPVDLASQLSRWVATGRLVRLRRGLYVMADPYASRRPHPFEIANAFVRPSYVSLEYALGWYGIAPESVFAITSVTTGRAGAHDTPFGRFVYRHVRPAFLWGYALTPVSSGPAVERAEAFVASPEKALLDLLYFRRHADDRSFVEELRLELEGRLDVGKLVKMSRRAGKPRLIRAASLVAELAARQRDEYRDLGVGERRVKDRMIALVSDRPPAVDGVNLMREYLQATMLASMQAARALRPLAFHGGTCLRFLYRTGRFSEDLDFALERPDAGFRFADTIARVARDLTAQGYVVRATVNDEPVVNKAFVGFVGAEYEAGLSPHRDKVFRIKIEVDTRPPAGASLEISGLRAFEYRLRLQHHDLSSLFAGKLAAVLARKYTKGRDLYDLLWYLEDARRPSPNLEMLANALGQTAPATRPPEGSTWPAVVLERLGDVDWASARAEVGPFLERPNEAESLTYETFDKLLSDRGAR